MDVFVVVEWMTVVVTFVMMLSGIPPCISMYKTKETKNIPFLFFLICLMVSLIALYYGLLMDNMMLIVVNLTGSALWGIYAVIYVMVTKSKSGAITKLVAVMAMFFTQIAYLIFIVQSPEKVLTRLGSLLFLWTTIVSFVPAAEIFEVLKEKNSDGVPVSLLVGTLLNTFMWFLYGFLLNDINIYGPNIPGFMINLARLALLFAYRGGTKNKVE